MRTVDRVVRWLDKPRSASVATGLSTFPDISVVCGDLERASDDANAITNPALLVEVLNPSTEDYDQGEKLRHYQQIPSLEAVVFVSQSERMVSVVRRTWSGWLRAEHRDAFEARTHGHHRGHGAPSLNAWAPHARPGQRRGLCSRCLS
ncbi:MAG: Uma2 family endonuclease [Myxococcales bacterium]|nr:Uma2 family endonuclease [Myxococcales bacterium]